MNEIEKGQLVATTVQCFTSVNGSLSSFPGLLKKVITEKAWEWRIYHGREYRLPNLRALITERVPTGWGQDPDKIEAVIKDDAEALAMFRDAMTRESHRPLSNYNVISKEEPKPKQGNSKAYTLDRLKRTKPDLFQAVCNGEMSANAAAIAAGFRKVRTPLEVAERAAEKLTHDERRILIARIKSLP